MSNYVANLSSLILRNIPSHYLRKKYAKAVGPFFEGIPAKTAYGFTMLSNYYDNTCRHAFEGSYGVVADFIRGIPSGAVFLDIGANQGGTSLLASEIIGDQGIVLSFEPSPKIYSLLEKNIRLNSFKNIKTFNFAVGFEKKVLFLDDSDIENSGGSHISEIGTEIFSRPLDLSFIGENYNNQIVQIFVKIDTEGFEIEVLKGITNLLESRKVKAIVIEINDNHLSRFNTSSADIYQFLEKFNYDPQVKSSAKNFDEIFKLRV